MAKLVYVQDEHGNVSWEQLETLVSGKANASDVYTKEEADAKFATQQ